MPKVFKREFVEDIGLSLDGQWTNWYSQHEITKFHDFEQLKEKFIRLFHGRIPQHELMSRFYAISQDTPKTVTQFIIRFQNLRR